MFCTVTSIRKICILIIEQFSDYQYLVDLTGHQNIVKRALLLMVGDVINIITHLQPQPQINAHHSE